jgi:hypothetical protein
MNGQVTNTNYKRDARPYASRVCVTSADMLQWVRCGFTTFLEIHLMVFVISAGAIVGMIQAYGSISKNR